MKNSYLFPILLILFSTLSCEKDKDSDINLKFENINGYVQKGPYLNGTTITISELRSDLGPTGRTFNAQILDNKGRFEIKNVELFSQFVELRADGFYFDEVKNENSKAQLTLYALSDLTDKSSLNVNVLSHLEKGRVEYLMSNGSDFSEAKYQAQNEILTIFNISKDDMVESELLDITKPGADNAILLAVSVILQAHLSVSDLSELLANISTDIREDGILNSQLLGSVLINNAKTIQFDEIRQNLEDRYGTLGLDIIIPDFEIFANQFIDNTEFEFTAFIEYPASGEYGFNILDKNKTSYAAGTYSMNAILPEGSDLEVKIRGQNWAFPISQENTGWTYSKWNTSDYSRVFKSTRTGNLDFELRLEHFQDSAWSNLIKIFVYENESLEPSFIREFEVN